jgi:hypothetical protein
VIVSVDGIVTDLFRANARISESMLLTAEVIWVEMLQGAHSPVEYTQWMVYKNIKAIIDFMVI